MSAEQTFPWYFVEMGLYQNPGSQYPWTFVEVCRDKDWSQWVEPEILNTNGHVNFGIFTIYIWILWFDPISVILNSSTFAQLETGQSNAKMKKLS